MKKYLFSLMLLVVMALPIPIVAQNYGHHIVADGTASNQYVPIYGRMCMYMQRTQSVYPASMLTSLQDGTITTLRYYMQTPASVVWSCPFQIKMGTISSTTLTSLASDADFTTVYTGMLDATDTVMTIELDVPFTYTGGNLVVEIANTATVPQMEIMSYNNNKFYGISQTGASWACTNNPTGQARAFLPKVDFLCENIACPKVSTITLDELGATTVAFSWSPVVNSIGYLVSINGGDEDYVSDTSFFYDELTPTTNYTVSIRSVCSGGDTSAERNISFTTLCAAVELPLNEGFEGSDNLPACWTVLYDYTEGSTHGISIGRSGAYAGNNCLTLKAQWGSTQALALATPLIAQPVNTISVEFYAAGEYSSAPTVMAYNSVEVGYVKSLLPNSTFYPVQTITFTQEDVYDHYEISFAALEDSDDSVYVVFRRPGDNNVRPVKVDDILIRTANPCFNPQTFSFQSTGSGSVSFVWGDTINNEWEIAYGPAGMGPDTMDRVASYISSQPYTITDLSNDTTYDFYLRGICGDAYSYWIGPVTARPNSIEMAKTGTNTITSCGVTIFDNGGGMDDYTSSCNSILTIYPEGDDQVVRLSGNYFTESNYDFIYLYDGAGTDGLSLGTYSGTGTIDTVSSVGPLTMKFYSDGGTEAEGFQLVVSCEERNSCVPPYALEVSNVAVTNAQISWTFNPAFPDPDHYSVAVTNQATGAVTYYVASSSPYPILALQPSTTYSVSVSAICMSGDSASSTPVTFTTRSLPCAGADLTQEVVDSLYLGASTTIYLPSWSVYNYGLSQQVYRQEEMNDMGRITGLKFKASAGSSTRLLSFYLGHTTLNSLDAFIMPSDMTLVASGPYMFGANREIEVEFTTPFDYNGSDNLVLTILDNTGSYQAGNYTYCSNITPNTSVYAATDNNPYNPLNPPATASTTNQRMNIIWMGNPCSGHSTCVAPTLSASDILSNEVTLTWFPGNTENAWKVEYKETLEEDWITAIASTSNTTYTVSGLVPQTSYSFRVTALCDEESMASSSVTVTTPCGAYPLPYIETFDNGFIATSSVGNFQPCWNRICSYAYSTYPYLSDAYAFSGSHSLYFYSTEYYEAVAVLPIMDAPVDSLVLSFSAFKSGATHDIKVGVMTDPNDFSTFTLVSTVSPSATSTWETFEVPFTEYQGTGHYIALACYDKVSYIYVDNILIDTYLPCPRVTGVTLDTATLTTAALHWNASATSYQVQYGPYGFTLGEGTILNVSDTSVLLTGLDNSMRYDVYVRGNCGADGYGHWSFVTTIATACGNLHTIPYYENFDSWMASAALVPMCWNNGGTFGPYIVSAYDYNNAGASLYFSCTSSMPKAFVMLPEIDSQIDISDLEISFAMRASSGGTLRIGFSPVEGDTTGFVPVETLPITSGNNFIDQLVPLTSYTGTARHLTFIFAKGSSSNASYYLDEVTLEPYSACLRPTNLAAANATDQSVELSWTDNASASQWEVAYCPSNQQFNNSTTQHVVATSNPFTLTGLNPQTSYIFKVRAICGSGDTGYYSNRSGNFTTAQSPAAVPYSYDFENVDEWNEWQTSCSSTQVAWRRGTATAVSGTHAAYITSDHGATPSTIANVVAFTYRDFDFGTIDTNYTLRFKAQVADNGNQTLNYKVFFVDPGQPVFAPSSYYNTPWGAIDTITPLITVHPSDTWQDYAVELPHLSGIHRLVFCYNNGNVSANFTTPAQLDDIEISYTTCPRPEGLQATTVGSDYVTISWDGPTTDYLVTLTQNDNSTTQQFIVHSSQITIDDLVPATYYSASVCKVCAPGDTSLVSESIEFRTDCLSGPISIYPWIEDFENGLSCWQQEMRHGNNPWQTAGYYENVGHMPPSGATIAYLDHNTDGDSTMLISPVMAISNGSYMTFAHMQMAWSGDQDTLVVLYRSSASDAWHELATYTNSIEDWQTDSLALPNPSDSYQVAFLGCDHYGYGIGLDRIEVVSNDACSSPVVLSRTITHNAITLNWGGSASGYEIAIKPFGASSFPMAQYVTSTSHRFSDLEAEMRYVIRLRSVCSDVFDSRWTYDTILTHAVPCTTPEGLAFIDSTYSSVTVDWTPTGLEQLWIVQLQSSRLGLIADTVSEHPYTFENLETGDSYSFIVCALCDPISGDQSPWSDTLYCAPIDCAPVSDIQLGELTDSYLEISWIAGGDETSWMVEYGAPGFDQGLGLGTVVANENPFRMSLAALQPETNYELYVYARCTESATSVPVGPVAFRTGNVGISGIEGNANINIYPNPTTGTTTISVSGINGKVTIEIVDMNGRTINSTTQQINNSTDVNVNGLTQGAYFVRIYGEEINSIRKLIVR